MTRNRAALLHLAPSLLLLAVCAGLVVFAWYPHPLLNLSRPGALAAVLVIAACLVGPALTWLVCKPGKSTRALAFDLVVVTLVQLSAMAWGMYNLSVQKPYFMVFTLDRFETLARKQVTGPVNDTLLLDKPLMGPAVVYAEMPTDPVIHQRLLQEVMFEGKPDLQFRPEFWRSYADHTRQVLQRARPLEQLRDSRPQHTDCIDDLVGRGGTPIEQLVFVPGMMGKLHFSAVLDGRNGGVVGYLDVDPWIE